MGKQNGQVSKGKVDGLGKHEREEAEQRVRKRLTMAATSQTEDEVKKAEQGHPDGSKSVEVPKRIWRPKVRSEYIEPEEILDTSDDVDWLFENCGHSITKQKTELEPRDDIIEYDSILHEEELKMNLQWRDCPEWIKPIVLEMIKDNWDVFAKEGMKKSIRGYEFNIDTGDAKPITCKTPNFGPHEERVIILLVKQLDDKDLIEDDYGPWGSPIVLASKPNQGHKHWSEYIFRLCVSYRALNAITRPFLFPVRRCDDAVEMVGPARYVITMDLDAGYWQMLLRKSCREKTAFYIPRGKKHWKVTPMGATNAHPAFVCMAMEMEDKWNEEYKRSRKDSQDVKAERLRKWMEATLKDTSDGIEELERKEPLWTRDDEPEPKSAVIVDDIILAAVHATTLLFYFMCVLQVLKHHRVTVNLRKSRFMPRRAEFVGIDVLPSGNAPAESKNKAIKTLGRPVTFTDLRLLIGLLGFYRNWIPLYETRIAPWRKILKKQPATGTMSKEEEATEMTKWWKKADRKENPHYEESEENNDKLLEILKQEILDGPVLKRPDPNRRFYLKTDWSCLAQGGVLLQADLTEGAEASMLREMWTGECEFDKKIEGLRLRPIYFISQYRTEPSSRHSFVGEAATGRWAMLKFKKFLLGREFTWITDCSGLRKFFETEYEATHTIQRWKLELLRFDFTIVHRPEKMLTECNMLSRYNTWTSKWDRKATKEEEMNQHKKISAVAFQGKRPTGQVRYDELCEWIEETEEVERPMEKLRSMIAKLNEAAPIPMTRTNIRLEGPIEGEQTEMAKEIDDRRITWIIGAGASTMEGAAERIGISMQVTKRTDEVEEWQYRYDMPTLEKLLVRINRQGKKDRVDWLIIHLQRYRKEQIRQVCNEAKKAGVKTIMVMNTNSRNKDEYSETIHAVDELTDTWQWECMQNTLSNTQLGGVLEAETNYWIYAPTAVITAMGATPKEDFGEAPRAMEDVLQKGDYVYDDCIPYVRKSEQPQIKTETKKGCYFAVEKGSIQYWDDEDQGKVKVEPVYDVSYPFPNLRKGTTFLVEAVDGVTSQRTRRVRQQELLEAVGFEKEKVDPEWKQQWSETAERLQTTTPMETATQLLAAVVKRIE